MANALGTLALDGGDPREPSAQALGEPQNTVTHHNPQKLHDPSVTFEEYLHYAKISRADTRYEDPEHSYRFWQRGKASSPIAAPDPAVISEKTSDEKAMSTGSREAAPQYMTITDDEYVTASRAIRTATWGSVFFLITTDILGPFSTPWAFAAMGYGPGVILYTIFALMAGYGGFLLWKLFLGMDSDRYPLKTYGDIAFRVYGTLCRHLVNGLQSVQLLFNVGIIIISNGQSLAQISKDGACFIILCFVWAIAGMLLGQIRTLQRLGWLANAAIWLNLFVIFLTMGIVAHSGVLVEAAVAQNEGVTADQAVMTTAGQRPGTAFSLQVVGLMQAVYSYGGAMLFVEFMSEMKRPFDFWKGMLLAQLFIYFFYMFFGLFVYSFQGQFTINPAYQGIANYTWSVVANSIELVSSLIAAILYGNIGLKVVYNNLLVDLFKFPGLATKAGKIRWVIMVPLYWGIAFIISAAIPQVSNLSGLVAAICILQFSYTFPPFFMLGYQIKKDAFVEGEGFNPATGQVVRHDNGFTRWRRGFMKRWAFNAFNVFLFLGSLTTAVLGTYSAIKGMITAYSGGAPASFSCRDPLSTA